jgi:hypothetical protein
MCHRPSERILLDGNESQFFLERTKGRGKSGWTCAYNHQVKLIALTNTIQLGNALQGASALFRGITDQPHTTQLTSDENTWNVCLEIATNVGDVDPTFFRPKYQRDGASWTCLLARPVSDAVTGSNKFGDSSNDPQHLPPFWAGCNTSATAKATGGVHYGVQGCRLC